MNRIQAACFCLIASASVLAGLLFFSLSNKYANTANADLVVNRGNLTVMTALTGNGNESLFVLDNASQTLLVYNLDVGKKSLDFADSLNLSSLWGAAGGGGPAGGGARRPR